MKLIHKYIIYAVLALVLAACNDLDEVAYSDVKEDAYSYTDPYKAMGIVYANMRGLFSHTSYYMLQETSSDELVMPANPSGWDDGGIYKRIHLHTWNSENPQMANMWNALYLGVSNANRVIEQLDTGKIQIPDGQTKEPFVAEMRVARAFFYWLLLDNFGDVPLSLKPLHGAAKPEDYPSKTARKEVYNFVVSEITAAMPALNENTNQVLYGRFNKWAAKALLANVYLNAAVYTGEAHWEDCLAQCNDITGKYALELVYRDIFKTSNESSSEIIFAVPFDENVGTGFFVEMFSWHGALKGKANMQATPWGSGSAMAVSQFIDTYDPADKRLAGTWLMGPQTGLNGSPLLGSYDKAGKQLNFTKDLPNGLYTGESEGYRMNKFEVRTGAKVDLGNDFPFFRYAQVLLMKAECLLRTGKSGEAAQLVTQVRTRSFADPQKAAVTGAQLLQNSAYHYGYVENYRITEPGDAAPVQYGRLLDELGWEFAWEATRRRDMIRFGTFTKKSWLSHKPNGDNRKLFPIPQEAINSNPKLGN